MFSRRQLSGRCEAECSGSWKLWCRNVAMAKDARCENLSSSSCPRNVWMHDVILCSAANAKTSCALCTTIQALMHQGNCPFCCFVTWRIVAKTLSQLKFTQLGIPCSSRWWRPKWILCTCQPQFLRPADMILYAREVFLTVQGYFRPVLGKMRSSSRLSRFSTTWRTRLGRILLLGEKLCCSKILHVLFLNMFYMFPQVFPTIPGGYSTHETLNKTWFRQVLTWVSGQQTLFYFDHLLS